MRGKMVRIACYCLSVLLLLPISSPAAPAITCHCFTDRTFDPARPTLADPYFLATTQNSFFAALFNVDKKTVVMKKQAGVSADDLWVAYWVASRSGKPGEALLAERQKKATWKEVIVPLGLPATSIGERFSTKVASGVSAAGLAQAIVDDMLIRYRLLGKREIETLRKEWASNHEVIFTALIAVKTGRPAIQIYRGVKSGAKSWGALLSEVNLQPAGLQSEFAALLKAPPR